MLDLAVVEIKKNLLVGLFYYFEKTITQRSLELVAGLGALRVERGGGEGGGCELPSGSRVESWWSLGCGKSLAFSFYFLKKLC